VRLAGWLAGMLALAALVLCAGASAAGSLTTLPTAPVPTVSGTTANAGSVTFTPTGPVTVPAASPTSSGGLSKLEEAGIFVVGALLLAGIARLIMRDARSHTPAGEAVREIDRPKGTVAPIDHRLKRTRAKAKRARRARRAGR
jgi:hypothetical protein